MLIALAQISPVLGEVDKNLRLHIKFIDKALQKGANVIVFPELSLTGYRLRDLTAEAALVPETSAPFGELVRLSRRISIVAGFVEATASGRFYNAAAFLSGGRILHIHRKVFLPTFGMFEEARFFAPGRDFRTFDSPLGRTGLMICRDFLQLSSGSLLQAGGAETIIVLSAAPGRGGTEGQGHAFATSRMWELMGETLSFFTSAFVVYCNRSGFEDGAAFAGGSFVYTPLGRLLAKAAYAEKDFLFAEIDRREILRARRLWSWTRDDKPEVALRVLQRVFHRHED
ncbi:MAG: carbon-nitrogen hydrolase [Candidatus Aminicenantes bacterium]|nr:carbon-nitrogen hydrolase [Candidatus Aminicenantes bacterium]